MQGRPPCWRTSMMAVTMKAAVYHQYGGPEVLQYADVPRPRLGPGEAITYEAAAAFPTAFGTAWHMLITTADLRPGETALIHAASSGVSSAAIQIAKAAGAYVYTTGSADWKLAKAKALGADETINYVTHDFQAEIMRLTGKRGVDLVFEHIGGDVWEKSIRCLTRGGRLVTTGGTASYDVS